MSQEILPFVPFILFEIVLLIVGVLIAKKKKYSVTSAVILMLIPLVNIFGLIYLASRNDKSRENALLVCCVIGCLFASIQRFMQISSTEPLSAALLKSFVFGLALGLVYAIPFWVVWKVYAHIFQKIRIKQNKK